MPRKKRAPLGEGVVGHSITHKPIKWGVEGTFGTKYSAVWRGERVRLEVDGGFLGEVPLREGAGEAEAKQVAGFYLGRFAKREAAGFKPIMR